MFDIDVEPAILCDVSYCIKPILAEFYLVVPFPISWWRFRAIHGENVIVVEDAEMGTDSAARKLVMCLGEGKVIYLVGGTSSLPDG